MKVSFHYTVCGRLASGCSHMVPTTRERARKLLKRSCGIHDPEWTRSRGICGYRAFDLNISKPMELYKEYTYQEVILYIGIN